MNRYEYLCMKNKELKKSLCIYTHYTHNIFYKYNLENKFKGT